MTGLTHEAIPARVFPSLGGNKYYRSDIPRLDPDKKHIWLEALENEEKYQQGMHMLKTPNGKFCCLGVYCDAVGVPESETDGAFNSGNGGPKFGVHPIFGDKEVRGPDGITRDWRNSVIIPENYRIPYHNVPDITETCVSWTEFAGDEEIFFCMEQGKRNDVTGEATIPEEHRRVFGHALPGLNDSGEFNFSQIRDIINYFL